MLAERGSGAFWTIQTRHRILERLCVRNNGFVLGAATQNHFCYQLIKPDRAGMVTAELSASARVPLGEIQWHQGRS